MLTNTVAYLKTLPSGTEVENFEIKKMKLTSLGLRYDNETLFATIEDNTGAISLAQETVEMLIGSSNLTSGNLFSGIFNGIYKVVNGIPTLIGDISNITIDEGEAAPTEATIASVKTPENLLNYVKLSNVNVTGARRNDFGNVSCTVMEGEETIQLDELFEDISAALCMEQYILGEGEDGTIELPETFESITAIVSIDENGQYVLWPTAAVARFTIPVTVSDAGFATFCPTMDLDFSAAQDITAYKAQIDGDNVILTKVTTVAKNEGVLLSGRKGEVTTEDIANSVTVLSKNADNAFIGVSQSIWLSDTDGEYTNYVLSKEDGVVGFFIANNTRVTAGKAYLQVPTASSAKSLKMVFGDTTGINDINAAKADDAYYTISGVRVANPAKGLYIKNGKKVVIN